MDEDRTNQSEAEQTPSPLEHRKFSMWAILSLIFGVQCVFLYQLSNVCCGLSEVFWKYLLLSDLFGLVCGIVALVQIRRNPGSLKGRGMAVAGMIPAGLLILNAITYIVVAFTMAR